MTRRGLDRRTLLRGVLAGGAVSIGLPWLESFAGRTRAWAADEGFPVRFGLFTWGNGMLPARWIPERTGSGDAWALSEQLLPLARHKDVLAVVTGLEVRVPNNAPHVAGLVGMLSGDRVIDPLDATTFPGPTLDRWLADRIGGETLYPSVEVCIEPFGGNSFRGPRDRQPAEASTEQLWRRLFGPTFRDPGGDPVVDPEWALRRSVLDAVGEDVKRVKARVSVADRRRLDQHLHGIRALEERLRRLEEDPPDLDACSRPDAPPVHFPDVDGRPQMVEKNRVMSELIAMALACDQARVFSTWFSAPANDVLYPGISAGHHQLTHDEPGAQPQVHEVTLHVMACLADHLDALRAIPEGDGTLLDHCVVLGTSEVSLGRTHALDEFPVLLAGSAAGRLRTDVHVRSAGGASTSAALLTVIRALGVTAEGFGVGDNRATQSLGDLEA